MVAIIRRWNKITIWAQDISGNVNNTTITQAIFADYTAPTTTYNGPTGWQISDFNFDLNCTDPNPASGCNTIYYNIGGSSWSSQAPNITILHTTEGNLSLQFYSVDNAENDSPKEESKAASPKEKDKSKSTQKKDRKKNGEGKEIT